MYVPTVHIQLQETNHIKGYLTGTQTVEKVLNIIMYVKQYSMMDTPHDLATLTGHLSADGT